MDGFSVSLASNAADPGATLAVSRSKVDLPDLPPAVKPLSKVFGVELNSSLRTPADVTFDAPDELDATGLLPVVMWQDGDGGWRWLPVTWQPGDDVVRASTDHFSGGFLAGIDVKAWAVRVKQDFVDYVTGRSGVTQPTCGDEKAARAGDVTVTSDGGDRIKWCFGVEQGKRTLRVSNNTRTFQEIRFPSTWTVLDTGSPKIDDAALSRLVGGAVPAGTGLASRVVDGGDTLTLVLPAGVGGRVTAEMSISAWAVSGALFGAKVWAAVAGASKSALGSAAKSKADNLAVFLGLNADANILDAYRECLGPVRELASTGLNESLGKKVLEFTWTCTGALMRAQLSDVKVFAAGAIMVMVSTAVDLILTAANLLISGVRDVWDTVASFGKGDDDSIYDILVAMPNRQAPDILPAYPQTADAAKTLEAFLRRVTEIEQPSAGPGQCEEVKVAGADLPLGAADVYIGITPDGPGCGGDAAGTFYKVRNNKVIESGSACGDCEFDLPGADVFERLTKPYRDRTSAQFSVVAAAGGAGWRLQPGSAATSTSPSSEPAAACGTVNSSTGSVVTVSVARGLANCDDALRIIRAYYAAPPEDMQGNAAFWDSPDGWTCFSPTAGSAQDQGFTTACDRAATGARVIGR